MKATVSILPDAYVQRGFLHFPVHLAGAVRRAWLRLRNRPLRPLDTRVGILDDGREYEANTWLRELVAQFSAKALELGANEEALVEYAKARAEEGERLRITGASLDTLQSYCQAHGVELPEGKTADGCARRVGCSIWWRRHLRRENARKAETLSITLGLVQRSRGLYASHDAVKRRQEQRRRNRALLDSLNAINELGQEFSLSALADKSMSNLAIRRAELMARIAGFEYIAVSLDMAGEFVTLTAPSRFHPRRAKSGHRNPKFDGVSTPADTQAYLGKVWSRIISALARAGIKIFGFRVAEPHHDGTPHFHGLFFMERQHVNTFRCIVARHAVREDRDELGLSYCITYTEALEAARALKENGTPGSLHSIAMQRGTEAAFWSSPPKTIWQAISPRFCSKAIDWNKGSAAGYIAKYIAKNIDGQRMDGSSIGGDDETFGVRDAMSTARRVDAWASIWGIRQFQQVGGPPVGVWRELRRWDYTDAQDVLMQAAAAADAGHWARFVEVMGGHEKQRSEMPLQLAKEEEADTNRYGEPGQCALVGVVEVDSGQLAISRMHQWFVTRGVGRDAAPWTCVNNSTDLLKGVSQEESASDEDRRRWMDEIDNQARSYNVWPTEDSYLPPAELDARQQKQREALKEWQAEQAKFRTGSDFMRVMDELINRHRETADAEREATLLRVHGRKLYQSFANISSDRGIEVIADVKAKHEAPRETLPRPGSRRRRALPRRHPMPAEQITQAMDAARELVVRIDAAAAYELPVVGFEMPMWI